MQSYEEKIRHLKDGLEKAKSLRIQAETRLDELRKQENQIIAEIIELGVKPEELEEEIKSCEKKIEQLIGEMEMLIPWELLKRS